MSFTDNYCVETKFRRVARTAAAQLPPRLPPIFYCTDENRNFDNKNVISNLPSGWGVIYRCRNIDKQMDEVVSLNRLCKAKKIKFLLSQFPCVAWKIGADGVHWPESLLQESKAWRGHFKIMTGSVHSFTGLRISRSYPLDAVLYSSVFASESSSSSIPIGPIKYRKCVRFSQLPVYALAGVNVANAALIAAFGGIVAISGIARHFDK